MAKLHGLKKNLNPSRVAVAKLAAESDEKKGINRFVGRRSQRKKVTETTEEKNV